MLDPHATFADPAPPAGAWLYIAEMEHRVANEYALAVASISLAAAKSQDADVKTALRAAAQRLRDYADLHRSLQAPLTPGVMDLSLYLRGLFDALVRASLSERGVSLTLIEQAVEIDAQRCWRVGLIISELITNAVRHGFGGGSGAITIEMTKSASQVQCRVSDNGRPTLAARAGTGTHLVDSLAEALGGSVDRWFSGDGTTVVLSFPEVRPSLIPRRHAAKASSAWPS
jgi:two-component sensor histidine kinase